MEQSEKSIIVQKYGGSSLADPEKIVRVAQYIIKSAQTHRIVVVVSAMGDTTDKLLDLAKKVSGKEKPDPEELDELLVTGEDQSAPALAIALKSLGQQAKSLTAREIGLIAYPESGNAKVKSIQNIDMIKELLNKGDVVVVTGFQGMGEGTDRRVTLGRQGSDITAVTLAARLGAEICEMYTDVDGVFTFDPRDEPEAKRYDNMHYSQMIQLSAVGAMIRMTRAIIAAQNHGVKLKIMLSPSLGESTGGTLVHSGASPEEMEGEIVTLPGVGIQKGLVLITISNIPNQPRQADRFFAKLKDITIFATVGGGGAEIAAISILVQKEDLNDALAKLNEIKEINITTIPDVVELTLIDPTAKGQPGYFYRLCHSLQDNIEAFAAVALSMMVVVKEKDLRKATQAIGKEFNLLKQ